MPVFAKNVINIVEPALQFTDDVTLTTDETLTYHSYVIESNRLRLASSSQNGSYIVSMPPVSNIRTLEKHIRKECHAIPNCNTYGSHNNKAGISQKVWTDSFGRVFASKTERGNQGVTFRIRGDIAMGFVNHGLSFIQCNQLVCNLFYPTKFSVDMTKFGFEKPSMKKADDQTS